MGKYLYMAVTADDFEFPIAIEDTVSELANKLGVEPMSIYSSISNNRSGKIIGHKFLKIRNL